MNDPAPAPRRRARITRSGDFDAVYRRGRSSANRHLVVYAFPRPDAADELRPGTDLVVIARPGLARYLEERGSAAVAERLRELALKVAGRGDPPA